MIAYIQGSITYKSPTQIVIEVGGIGYELHVSLHTSEQLKNITASKLFTYLHISQDAHTLYGFCNMEEKQWFTELLNVNGIGPRMALTILSYLTAGDLYQAIIEHNTAKLQAIKGIGQKVAQRIILELKDKVAKQGLGAGTQLSAQNAAYQEALAALSKLGIPKAHAEKNLAMVAKNHEGEITVEELIKLALKG